LVDQQLPDSTGIELGAALKAADEDLQLIVLTGYATLEGATAAVGHAHEFLTKPVNPDELVRTLKAAIEQRRHRREKAALVAQLQQANVQLSASIADRTSELVGLAAMAGATALAQDLDEVADAVVVAAAAATNATAAAVYLDAEGAGPPVLRAQWPSHGGFPRTLPHLSTTRGHTRLGVPSQHTVRADLLVAQRSLGALLVTCPQRASASFLATLAIEAAVALQNAQRSARERETVQRLSELSRLKSAFLATVSHELRTPLTAVVGLAQSLAVQAERLSPAERNHMLDRIVVQGERLGRLIENLLDSTGIEAGTLRVSIGVTDIRTVIDRVVDGFSDARLTIEIKAPKDLPLVLGDDNRLEQVLTNLVDNAAKHSPPGGLVTIGAEARPPVVELWVADQGTGVDPSFLPRAFDAFSQADSSERRRHQGAGLGLYIARGLVEAMGGTIDVVSRSGEGACFGVKLRVAP